MHMSFKKYSLLCERESEVVQSCLTLWDPWTVALQALLSMGFSRQGYWSGLPFPPPGDLPDPGIEAGSLLSLTLAGGFFPTHFPDEEAETWGNNATWLGRTRASLGCSRLEVALAPTPSKMSPFTCLSLTSRGRRVYKASVEIQASRANP